MHYLTRTIGLVRERPMTPGPWPKQRVAHLTVMRGLIGLPGVAVHECPLVSRTTAHRERNPPMARRLTRCIARIVRGIDRHTLVTMNPADPRRLR